LSLRPGGGCSYAAVANARLAYAAYEEVIASDRWKSLADAGANAQRPLWASTGVKNPDYPDTLYVTELVVANTVNTMPEKTLDAFADHGEVGPELTVDSAAARETLARVAQAGIDLDATTAELERDGVRSFCGSYHDLLACIETKVERTAAAA